LAKIAVVFPPVPPLAPTAAVVFLQAIAAAPSPLAFFAT